MEYEKGRVDTIGEKHKNRMKLIADGEAQNKNFEQIMKEYREQAQTDGVSFKDRLKATLHNMGLSDGSVGYDDSLNADELLTPQKILDYEKRASDKEAADHENRLKELQESTDENAWEKYKELGGGKGFLRSVERELLSSEERKFHDKKWGFAEIHEYEKGRLKYYQGLQKRAAEPKTKLENMIAELDTQIQESQKAADGIKKYLGKKGMQTVFVNSEGFQTFVSESGDIHKSMQNVTQGVTGLKPKLKKQAEKIRKNIRELNTLQLAEE